MKSETCQNFTINYFTLKSFIYWADYPNLSSSAVKIKKKCFSDGLIRVYL